MDKHVVVFVGTHTEPMEQLMVDCCDPSLDLRFTEPHFAAKGEIADAEALIVSGYKVTAEMMDSAPKLRMISNAGAAFSCIDINAAKERGIFACNVPGKNAITTAEMTIALMLACWRRIPMVDRRVKSGEWHKYTYRHDSYELYGKTIGIVGAGRIGRLVMERLQGWGVNIIYFDPYPMDPVLEEKYHAKRVDLDTLCREADAIALNCPLTDTTRGMINMEKLKLMKPTAIIVNEARGAVINLNDLAEALEKGIIWGAAIDVWEPEPCDPNSPLLKMEKVITTSHLGASTRESLIRVYSEVLANTARLFKDGRPENIQNGL